MGEKQASFRNGAEKMDVYTQKDRARSLPLT